VTRNQDEIGLGRDLVGTQFRHGRAKAAFDAAAHGGVAHLLRNRVPDPGRQDTVAPETLNDKSAPTEPPAFRDGKEFGALL